MWFLRFLCFWCSFCGSKCFFIVFNGFLVVLCVFCIFRVLSVFLSFLKVCEGSLGFLCVSSIFPNFLSKSYVFSAFLTCACLPGLAVVASSVQQFMGKGSQPPLRQTSAKPNLKAMASRATKSPPLSRPPGSPRHQRLGLFKALIHFIGDWCLKTAPYSKRPLLGRTDLRQHT